MSVSDINTKVLMHMNESTLKDEVGHNVTNISGVTLNSTTKKFGVGSAYFNGTSYLSVENSTDFQFGSSNFTIEMWVNLGTSGKEVVLYYKRIALYSFSNIVIVINTNRQINVAISSNNSTWDMINVATSATLDINKWYHIAIIRNGNNFYASINGKLYLLGTSSLAISNNTANISIGGVPSISGFGNVYIDEFRISNIARWTTDFTPNTIEYGIILKYLIQDGTELKTINGSNLVTVCNTTDDDSVIENSFLTNGLDNLSAWNNSLASQINNNTFKVAIYRKYVE